MAQVSPTASSLNRPRAAAVAQAGDLSAVGETRPKECCSRPTEPFVMRWLTTLTVLGCALGVATGFICRATSAPEAVVKVIRFPGMLFVRALKCVIVPMVFSSMVSNMGSLGVGGAAGRMTRTVVAFYASTTVLAACTGLVMFNLFRSSFSPMDGPQPSAMPQGRADGQRTTILDIALHFGTDLVPDNLVDAFLHLKLLGIITFSMAFGLALARTPNGKVVIEIFDTCFNAFIQMIRQVILLTPICIGSLVAGAIATSAGMGSAFASLGVLIAVAVMGQLFHVLVTYTSLYAGFTKKNPFRYLAGLPRVWLTAFGTSSSAATLSVTCQCCEELGVSKKAINFALPLGCTVNMDGSTLERPISVLWCLAVAGQPISAATQIGVALTSALLSVGTSPVPSAGLATLMLLLDAAGVEVTAEVEAVMGLLFAVEWLLDSIRTAVNVTGDAVGVAILDHLIKEWPSTEEANVELGCDDSRA